MPRLVSYSLSLCSFFKNEKALVKETKAYLEKKASVESAIGMNNIDGAQLLKSLHDLANGAQPNSLIISIFVPMYVRQSKVHMVKSGNCVHQCNKYETTALQVYVIRTSWVEAKPSCTSLRGPETGSRGVL